MCLQTCLIVLHLYSLLLACFILQSVVVVIVWQFLLCYTCIHYYYHTSYFSPSWSWSYSSSYCVTLVFTTITMLHTSAGSVVVVIVWLFLLCYTCIHYYYHTSYFSPSWSYGSSYCVTLVFTTITILHTSVRRGLMVVIIVLHLYSLLLPYFILQSVVVLW